MKFPLEFVTRFFFKSGLNQQTGSVLELGCGNGNNLMLFYQYGWNVVGIDIDPVVLEQAEANFEMVDVPSRSCHFIRHDIAQGLTGIIDGHFDVIVLSGILPYITRSAAVRVLGDLRSLGCAGARVYLNVRGVGDYRYGRGEEVERNSYRLAMEETGELGLLNVFYHDHEIVGMLCENLGVDMSSVQVLHDDYQNIQNGRIVNNSDIIIWGRIRGGATET